MISEEEYEKLRRDPGPVVFDGIEPALNQSLVSDLQPPHTNEELVNGGTLEQESTEDATLFTNHPVDRLWKFCDSVDSSVKLLLPDSKLVPFYLRKPNNKEKNQKAVEREQRVFDLFVQREVEEQRSKKSSISHVSKTSALSLREERIGRDLILEYQQDPEKLINLVHKYEKEKAERKRLARQSMRRKMKNEKEKIQLLTSTDRTTEINEEIDINENEAADQFPTMTLQNASIMLGKMERVLCRRATLMKEHEKEMQVVVDKWQAKVEQIGGRRQSTVGGNGIESFKLTPLAVIERQDRWIGIVLAMRGLTRMKEIVCDVREKKALDRRRWFALRLIQRCVRTFRRNRRKRYLASLGISADDESFLSYSEQTAVPMLRRSMAGPEELVLYQKRVESASIIVSFLKICSTQYRSIMHRYFRKVIIIQRRVQRHLIANKGRYELIETYFDRIFPSFFAYLSMILSGKGNDLKNLTSLDLSRMRIHTRNVKQFSVVDGFDSPSFHAFLRENKTIFQSTSRFLGPSRNSMSTQMVNLERIKRHVLLSLIFRKRYQSATQLESVKPIVIPSQTISRNDVLAFIRGERDPVIDYLNEIKRIEDEHRAQYYAKKEASKHGRVYRKFTGKELFLSMLTKISAEDFAIAVMNITEIAMIEFDRQTSQIPNSSLPGTANGRKPTSSQLDKQSNVEGNMKIMGNNLSVMAMFMSRNLMNQHTNHQHLQQQQQQYRGSYSRSSGSRDTDRLDASSTSRMSTAPAPSQAKEKDSEEMQQMIMDTARRIEAAALSQQRQELVYPTRRNSSMVASLRRSSMMTGAMNPIAAAAAAAATMVNQSHNSPSIASSTTAEHSSRPGRRLSQMTSAQSGNAHVGTVIPKKPEDRRRSVNFSTKSSMEANFHNVGV